MARFATVAIDVDSTLSGIEGIDWLAGCRDANVAARISALTNAAMTGRTSLDEIYRMRLDIVRPTQREVISLSAAYRDTLAPGAAECIAALQKSRVRVLIISSGVHQAILPVSRALGVPDGDVHGVSLRFSPGGGYGGYDAESPLTKHDGKSRLLNTLADSLALPVLHVGDGITDAVAREAVDAFAAFTGFVTREPVVARADYVVATFEELRALVLGGT